MTSLPNEFLSAAALALVTSLAPAAHGELVLLDVGDAIAQTTGTPLGNVWNNLTNSGPVTNLLTTTGVGSGINVTVTGGNFGENGGSGGGGLANPSVSLLGDLAVASATNDYFFTQGIELTFSGLDDSSVYTFQLVGSRFSTSGTDSRSTGFVATGANSASATLQTTGVDIGANLGAPATGSGQGDPNIYDGFDGSTAIPILAAIQPSSGVITLDVDRLSGSNAYLNALSIEIAAIPEASPLVFMTIASLVGLARRRRGE